MKRPWITLMVVLVAVSASVPAGAARAPGTLSRLSVTSTGDDAQGASSWVQVSADGSTAVFSSDAPLIPADTNGLRDVYVKDLRTGELSRASVRSDGGQSMTDSTTATSRPSLSADGRVVAFESGAKDLVPGDTNNVDDVFVHFRDTGETRRVSVSATGQQASAHSQSPAMAGDGRSVFFASEDDTLVVSDASPYIDLFRLDLVTGALDLVSLDSEGRQSVFDLSSPSSNMDGSLIAWASPSPTYGGPDLNGIWNDIFVRDLTTGITERITDAALIGPAENASVNPVMSLDGRFVTFGSLADNLIPSDTNGFVDVYLYDRVTQRVERVSVDSAGAEVSMGGGTPFISADGRFVSFNGVSTELDPVPEGNFGTDAYVHDRITGTTMVLSTRDDGRTGDDLSFNPAISGDGSLVAFVSRATDLLPGDFNDHEDVYLRNAGPSLGVGDLLAGVSGDVSGWARFGGTWVSATDPANDATFQARIGGGEILGGTAVWRPERDDLYIRVDFADLPHVPVRHVGVPRAKYTFSFKIGSIPYTILLEPAVAEKVSPVLQRCTPTCETIAVLSGGLGQIGASLTASVPRALIGAAVGTRVKNIMAGVTFSAPLVTASGDALSLDDLTLGESTVWVGHAPAGTPLEAVPFVSVGHVDGSFAVNVGALSGPTDVWAKSCIGSVCGPALLRTVG